MHLPTRWVLWTWKKSVKYHHRLAFSPIATCLSGIVTITEGRPRAADETAEGCACQLRCTSFRASQRVGGYPRLQQLGVNKLLPIDF